MGGVLEPITEALRTALQRAQGGSIGLTDADLAGDIGALQQVISAATAAQTVRIAQFAARDEHQDPTGPFVEVDLGLGHVAEFAADTLAPMLGMSHGPAQRRVHTAAKLASALPRTMRALADAELDPFRAQLIADELALADRSACAEVEELIHPGVCADTPTQVRRRVRQALASVDPDAVAARAARARLERFVTTRAGQVPGITEWWAHLPAEDSVKCWAAIDALAHRRRQDDPTLTPGPMPRRRLHGPDPGPGHHRDHPHPDPAGAGLHHPHHRPPHRPGYGHRLRPGGADTAVRHLPGRAHPAG